MDIASLIIEQYAMQGIVDDRKSPISMLEGCGGWMDFATL